jgi:hypothetical protein
VKFKTIYDEVLERKSRMVDINDIMKAREEIITAKAKAPSPSQEATSKLESILKEKGETSTKVRASSERAFYENAQKIEEKDDDNLARRESERTPKFPKYSRPKI